MIIRRISSQIEIDLQKKMVILSGPRQCGKTTLSKSLLHFGPTSYMSWDDPSTRLRIQKGEIDFDSELWIFDELHKYRKWRTFLKGLFDLHHEKHKIFVTGSAQLEAFSRGGDSLQGRYFGHRLHPITFSEMGGYEIVSIDEIPLLPLQAKAGHLSDLETLLKLSGFPEPLLSGSEKEASRWRISYGAC